jgi:hypothetical protein
MPARQTLTSCRTLRECVVHAVADTADTDPAEMTPPLYEAVDLEALDTFLDDQPTGHVRFTYEDHTVVVSGDGTVTVDDTVYQANPLPKP